MGRHTSPTAYPDTRHPDTGFIARLIGCALAAVLTVAVLAPGAASADTPAKAAEIKVAYADLDIATATGAQALLGRITVAAREACGEPSHSPLLPRASAEAHDCAVEAVDAAVKRIGSPLLAKLNNQPSNAVFAAR